MEINILSSILSLNFSSTIFPIFFYLFSSSSSSFNRSSISRSRFKESVFSERERENRSNRSVQLFPRLGKIDLLMRKSAVYCQQRSSRYDYRITNDLQARKVEQVPLRLVQVGETLGNCPVSYAFQKSIPSLLRAILAFVLSKCFGSD